MNNENNNTPRLRFPGFTGEWVEKKLDDVCKSITPPLKLQSKDYLLTGKYPIVLHTSRERLLQRTGA